MASLRNLARLASPAGEIMRCTVRVLQSDGTLSRPQQYSLSLQKYLGTKAEQATTDDQTTLENALTKTPGQTVIKENVSGDPEIDYSYFRQIVQLTSLGAESGRIAIDAKVVDDATEPSDTKHPVTTLKGDHAEKTQKKPSKVAKHIKPKPPARSATLVPYVNESETLQKLVGMKIDLSQLEKDEAAANFVVKADFDKDLVPKFFLLRQFGVEDSKLASVISKHPALLTEDADHMQLRINYLLSKGFPAEDIGTIVTRVPHILTTPIKKLDAQLGFLQQLFKLKGSEVRTVITKYPKLAVYQKFFIQENKMTFKEFLGYSDQEIKDILLSHPRLFLSNRKPILDVHEYLREKMNLSSKFILTFPIIFRVRISQIRQRHQFLKAIGRDQFDPKKPNYISLKAFCSGRDRDFCENVAKVSTKRFNEFLKTL